jgi:type I restriction enzyme R subunit
LNQNPEQIARDNIDAELLRCGWVIQNKAQINLAAATGVAVREYQTDIGLADYVLFVHKKPVGIIEAKRAEEGERLTMHEEQTEGYATAKLKYLNNEPLSFGYALPITVIPNQEAARCLPFIVRTHLPIG